MKLIRIVNRKKDTLTARAERAGKTRMRKSLWSKDKCSKR